MEKPMDQSKLDEEHLRLLTAYHYVAGGIMATFSLVFIFYIFMGTMMPGLSMPQDAKMPHGFDRFMTYYFVVIGVVGLVFGWGLATLTIYSGKCISQRKKYTLALIVSGLNCLWIPIGTILGVSSFIVLCRPSVKALFTS
jgi:hypothetical protein